MAAPKPSFFPRTRLSLMDALRDQQSPRWQAFYELYAPIIYRMALHGGLDANGAEEVLSVVMRDFVICVQRGFRFDPEKGPFRAYLRKATNRAISRQRRAVACGGSFDLAEVEEPSVDDPEPWVRIERRERARLCLKMLRESGELAPRDLAVFEAYALNEEPASAVAARHHLRRNRVYQIKHDGLELLRVMLSRLDREHDEP